MAFTSIFAPTATKPPQRALAYGKYQVLFYLIRNNFDISTFLLVGAILQSLLMILRPRATTALPAFLVLAFKAATPLLVHFKFIANPYIQGSIPGKTTAQIPSRETGEFPATPSGEKVVVALLGARPNAALGFLDSRFREIGGYIGEMVRDMEAGKETNGFLGQSVYLNATDRYSTPELMYLSYWRDIESLHAFAHSGAHLVGWQWWVKHVAEVGYIALNHEIYEADAGHWENIYINFHPCGLGATTYLKKADGTVEAGSVPDQWISPLVDARRSKMKTSAGRLGAGAGNEHVALGTELSDDMSLGKKNE